MPTEGPKLQNRYYQQRNDSSSIIAMIENGANAEHNRYYKSNKIATNYNKYLTFSKDQASSHFNALKEELGAQVSPPVSPRTAVVVSAAPTTTTTTTESPNHQARLFEVSRPTAAAAAVGPASDEPDSPSSSSVSIFKHPPSEQKFAPLPDTTASEPVTTSNHLHLSGATFRTTSPIARPRLSKQKQQQQTPIQLSNNNIKQQDGSTSELAASDINEPHGRLNGNNNNINNNNNTTKSPAAFLHHSQQQQPTCEAFIMTGQSMLKLSCNESEFRASGRQLVDARGKQINKTNFGNNIIQTSTSSSQIDSTNSSDNIDPAEVVVGPSRRHRFDSSGDQLEAPKSDIGARLRQLELEHNQHKHHNHQQRGKSQSVERLNSSGPAADASQSRLHSRPTTREPATTTTTDADSGDKEEKQRHTANGRELQQRQQQQQQQHEQEESDRSRRQWTTEAGGAQFELAASEHQRPFIAPPGGSPLPFASAAAAAAAAAACQRTKRDEMMDISKRRNLDQQPLVSKGQQENEEDGRQFVDGQHRNENQKQHSHLIMAPKELESAPMIQPTRDSDDQQQQQQQQQQPGCNERESARRLAKRLYNLSGFKKSDVCHHLSKSNPFSQMVAEEYLNLFDFRTMKLDAALRKFLSKLHLNGETQERERMLGQFSKRYYDCNKDKFPNADTVQTLVCALILLNTDLHVNHLDRGRGKNKRTKLSLGAFIDGLNSSLASLLATQPPPLGGGSGESSTIALVSPSSPGTSNTNKQPNTYTFPRHLLVDLYESIKKRPIKYVEDKCDMTSFEAELDRIYGHHQSANSRSNTLPTRRYAPGSNAPSSTMSARSRRQLRHGLNKMNGVGLSMDDLEFAIEFKSGFLFRKRVFEAHGKATPKGRRSWRQAHFILQDLRLIMRYEHLPSKSDDNKDTKSPSNAASKQNSSPKAKAKLLAQDLKNMVRIYHTFAKRSTSYTKREHVFHLQLADQSEFLIQAPSEQDMLAWIDTINFASACLSSPALPSAVINGKRLPQQRQPRPILPASYTKLSYWEQLIDHEERLQRLKVELEDHLNEAPNTKNASKRFQTEFIEKIAYLKHEIERYTVYVDLMRKKSNSPEAIILSKHPQIASLKPSDEMIKSLPSFAPLESAESRHSSDGEEAELRGESIKQA